MLDPKQLVGEQIKQYRIEAHIDRGGMADVYLAQDMNLQRKVALKIMLPAYAHDKQFVERFWREARTAARLDHPNIVQVYEISSTPGQRPYIAMQYIDGGSLKDKLTALDGRPLPEKEALTIIRQVADALSVAHNANVIHRDIKPSNILLRPNGKPVLVDLGIAAVQTGEKLTRTGTLIGTPHYMSPEQVSGKPVDGRSDLYSLGVVLYELLCGRRPFEATESLAVLHKHVYEAPQPLPERRSGLSQQTYRLVDICLQKDPNQRYQTAGELAAAIDRALAGKKPERPRPKPWQPPAATEPLVYDHPVAGHPVADEPVKQRPWWLAAIFVLLLAAVGSYFAFFSDGIGPSNSLPATAVTENGGGASQPENSPSTDVVVVEVTPTPEPPPPTAAPEPTEAAPPTNPPPTAAPPTAPPPTDTPFAGPVTLEIGRSVQNRPIEAVSFGSGSKAIIFVGGLHAGSAPGSVTLARQAVTYFESNPHMIPANATVYIIISANPDSLYAPGQLDGRLNANGVDLNRNWDCRWSPTATWRGQSVSGGSAPFSEPETQALRNFIQDKGAAAVIFWEARVANGLSSAGACSENSRVSGPLSEIYGRAAGYSVADYENLTDQTLNGDGANWLDAQGYPTISVLLPDYEDIDWNSNLAGILAVLDAYGQ